MFACGENQLTGWILQSVAIVYRVIYLCPLLFLSHLLSLLTLPQLNFIVHDLYIVGNDTYCTVLREKPLLYANTVCFYWIAEWS